MVEGGKSKSGELRKNAINTRAESEEKEKAFVILLDFVIWLK